MAAQDGAPRTRIQTERRKVILDAALGVFARDGFRGATLDEIAAAADMSKPNLLYYFDGKAAIHRALLDDLLELWLQPLRALDPDGDPRAELRAYVARKLALSRAAPRESRLFANEIIRGAPHISDMIGDGLKTLVDDKAAVIAGWAAAGRIAQVDPYHLIFAIWSTTQHYADFETQVGMILGKDADPFTGAMGFLDHLFDRALTPPPRR